MTDADWKRFKVQVDGEATEEDLLNLRSTASESGTAEQIAPQQTGEGDAQPTVHIDDSAAKIKEMGNKIKELNGIVEKAIEKAN